MEPPRNSDVGGEFEFLDHAADVGIRVRSGSLAGLFSTAAKALLSYVGPAPAEDACEQIQVRLEAEALDELMIRWLQELLYLFYQGHAYVVQVHGMDITDNGLTAMLAAKPWDESRYQEYQEVKAVTYHQLEVLKEGDTWTAKLILDI